MAPPTKTECDHGHTDWKVRKNGDRYCNTCHADRNAERDRTKRQDRKTRDRKTPLVAATGARSWSQSSRLGDRGPREDTFSIGEIMRARGYE